MSRFISTPSLAITPILIWIISSLRCHQLAFTLIVLALNKASHGVLKLLCTVTHVATFSIIDSWQLDLSAYARKNGQLVLLTIVQDVVHDAVEFLFLPLVSIFAWPRPHWNHKHLFMCFLVLLLLLRRSRLLLSSLLLLLSWRCLFLLLLLLLVSAFRDEFAAFLLGWLILLFRWLLIVVRVIVTIFLLLPLFFFLVICSARFIEIACPVANGAFTCIVQLDVAKFVQLALHLCAFDEVQAGLAVA